MKVFGTLVNSRNSRDLILPLYPACNIGNILPVHRKAG